MASAKRKQDEKHLKILRELVSLASNKECFDCGQRGPTYVNMTIGSFVCTSCSGLLRGLTPPHRVKSISMATFTQEEIDMVKERGNEHCRRIWLALTDSPLPLRNLDTKDDRKTKDLMSAKYEHKRWYLDPLSDDRKSETRGGVAKTCVTSQPSIPRVPLSTGALSRPATPHTDKNSAIAMDVFAANFVADFGKLADPFQAAATTWRFAQPIVPQPSFANFDNNPAFDSANGADVEPLMNRSFACRDSPNSNNNGVATVLPPSEDRYAALKDLDSLMKQTHLKDEKATTAACSSSSSSSSSSCSSSSSSASSSSSSSSSTSSSSSSPWTSNNSNVNASNSLWASSKDDTGRVIANPFTTGGLDLWRVSPAANLLNNNTQPRENLSCNSANPFRTGQQFSVSNNESQWLSVSANATDVIPSSQGTGPLSAKVWQPSVPTYHANPFTVATGLTNMPRNSNNPFL